MGNLNRIVHSPLNLPIAPGQPVTRPVASVADTSSEFRDATKQRPSTYVYRGELLEAVANERLYRLKYNLPVNLQQQHAVNAYHQVAHDQQSAGRILDGFI